MFNVNRKIKFYKSYNFSTQDLRYILYIFAVHTVTGTRFCTINLLHVTREFHNVKLIFRNLYAIFLHVKKAYTANQNGV